MEILDGYRKAPASFLGSERGSTTEPSTPEPPIISDEAQTFGDFARLMPVSNPARQAFNNLVVAIDKNRVGHQWHRRFVHVRAEPELFNDDGDYSTGDESAAPPLKKPLSLRTGFWRFNMRVSPANNNLGWVLGRGRWGKHAVDSHGGADILLTDNAHEQALRGRHARLLHNLESSSLLIFADKRMRFEGDYLTPGEFRAFTKRSTLIAFGAFEYRLEFTGLDGDLYKRQLAELARELKFEGQRPASFIDPTPTDTDYALKDKYTIRASFARGGSCWVCFATDKSGAPFAVKKIVANTTQMRLVVDEEVKTLKRITAGNDAPPSICRFVEFISIEPSKSSGITECYIVSQPLISRTLLDFLTVPDLPNSSRITLFKEMLDGLAFIHLKGCMHRDIKLENVVASTEPLRAVIIDFGAATWTPTSTDHCKGTIRYLAPEVIALKRQTAPFGSVYDRSADVWSMGLTAYEFLCGWRFSEQYITRPMHRQLLALQHWKWQEPPDLATVQVFQLIRQMLKWEKGERITAQEALDHESLRYVSASPELTVSTAIGEKRSENEVEPELLRLSNDSLFTEVLGTGTSKRHEDKKSRVAE